MEEQRARPTVLTTAFDYTQALLWLMSSLGQAPAAAVLREFDRRLGGLIPSAHRELNKSGRVKWQHYLRWSRQSLVHAGLMGNAGRGMWAITDAGRRWLEEHPEGGKQELSALLRGDRRKPDKRQTPEPLAPQSLSAIGESIVTSNRFTSKEGDITREQTIHLAGQSFTQSRQAVLGAVRAAIAQGLPPEARRFNDWYLLVDGEQLSVKWVVSLVTGLPRNRFDSPSARRQLQKLGLEALPVVAPAAASPVRGPAEPVELVGEEFMRAVLTHLGRKLPAGVYHPEKNLRADYLGLKHRTPRTWYEIWLSKKAATIGLTYYAPEDKNRSWAVALQPRLARLEARLAQPLRLSLVKSYAGLRLRLPRPLSSAAGAHELADVFLRFIKATLPILEQIATAEAGDLTREAFYQTILAHLSGRLPAAVYNRRLNPDGNYLQLACPLPGAHYEIVLRNDTEVGIHFESSRERNLRHLDRFQAHLSDLQSEMGETIQAERWGSSCARVYVKRPHCRLDAVTAQQIADVWLRFIEVTLPVVSQAAAELGVKAKGPRPPAKDLTRPQQILADKIRTIRAFLGGNAGLSPNDELLCDWIQFCYNFELFAEGAALFKLVRSQEVNPWLYERTRRLAQACRLRENG